jgi:hypothetical protein
MEKPNSISRISYVIIPSEPSVVTAKTEEISVVSVAAVFKSPPTPEIVSSAVVPSQVSEVDIFIVPLEELIEEVSVKSSPNTVSEFSYIANPLEVSEVSAFGGVQLPDQISEINIQSSPIMPEDVSSTEAQIWNISRVSVRVFYAAPPEVDIVSTSVLVAPNEPDTVSTELKMNQPTEVLVEYTPNSVLEESIIIGSQPKDVQLVEALSSSISEVDEVSVSYTPASVSVISVSYTTNDTSVPVVEYSSNSVSTVEVDRSPVIPSEISSGYIPYDVDSVNSEFTPSTALDIHPGYITYSSAQAVLHDIDNDLVTYASNPLKDRTTGRPALSCTNNYGQLRIYIDSEGDAYVLGKMTWGTEYTSWTKILEGVKSVWKASRMSTVDSYLFLKENSELWAWGVGSSGRLLTSNQSNYTTPIKVQENIKDVYCDGYNTTLALKNDGTLIGAGDNNSGVLNTGTRSWQYTVVQVTTNVKQVHFPYRDYIYILKNDNYIYVNGKVKGPQNNDFTQLHQWRGNVSEIFPDTQRGGWNPTYTYLNSSTHYRFSDYVYYSFNSSWNWQEASSGFSNVRYIEHDLSDHSVAIHTNQDIYYSNRPSGGTTTTLNIPYTGGTFGDVRYIKLGTSNHIIVRTDNTYVEVDTLLVKTSESDTNTLLETATLHTFPKYPIEVSNETNPFPVSVISTSMGPNEVESVDAGAFPEQPIETSIESTPSSVSVVSSVTLPSEVASVEIELNPLKEGDLSTTYALNVFYHYVPEQTRTRPIKYPASDLSTTSSINHSEYGYLNGRKTIITSPSSNSISTTRINGITGLERGAVNSHTFEGSITFLLRNFSSSSDVNIFYARDGGPWDGYSYRLLRMASGELRFWILDGWDDTSSEYLFAGGIYLQEEWNIIQITPGSVYQYKPDTATIQHPRSVVGNASISINGTNVWTASADDAYPYGTDHTTVRVAMNHIEFAPGIEIGDFIISKSAYFTNFESYPSSLPEDAGYIAHKYSLTHLLPDNHPYRFDEPEDMFYAVPEVNEVTVVSSPNGVSDINLNVLTPPEEVLSIASYEIDSQGLALYRSIDDYVYAYSALVPKDSNGYADYRYKMAMFITDLNFSLQLGNSDPYYIKNHRFKGMGAYENYYPISFSPPAVGYAKFTDPTPGWQSSSSNYTSLSYDLGEIDVSQGPVTVNITSEFANQYGSLDHGNAYKYIFATNIDSYTYDANPVLKYKEYGVFNTRRDTSSFVIGTTPGNFNFSFRIVGTDTTGRYILVDISGNAVN